MVLCTNKLNYHTGETGESYTTGPIFQVCGKAADGSIAGLFVSILRDNLRISLNEGSQTDSFVIIGFPVMLYFW